VQIHPEYGDKYRILDGAHRWHAYKEIGATEIPVLIITPDDLGGTSVEISKRPWSGRGNRYKSKAAFAATCYNQRYSRLNGKSERVPHPPQADCGDRGESKNGRFPSGTSPTSCLHQAP